ncbi:MAG: amidohydrolase family protein, partial [Dehalococcoidia bacterium]|nr:amidohydrolase family protein [Dehalococcoidia bacterium]
PAHWQLFQTIKANGGLSPRLTMMLGYKHLDEFLNQGMVPGLGDNHLRLGAVKIVLDESSGSLYPPQQELNGLVFKAHKAGYQVAIHAIDNVDAAATALEYAIGKNPKPHRHRIEHCSVCPPDTLNRLSKLGVIVVTQPPFLYYSGERYLSEVPKHQLPWLYRIKSFKEAGLRPAASSDSPVVTNNPLLGIYAAVMRKTETGEPILPEEVISAQEALEMYSLAAAYANFEENEKGTISPGKLADLVLLNNDPTRVPYDVIKDIKVEMTIIGGEVVWGGV